ncbi:MAG: dienelactone hydrolase family protein [Alphaproteobacteria bacterium]|mgnify:CR=1 FL=1|jgi:carboxymethylenebutenolidase|nr:dienelactone hydrolase family protein [Alphaproteobacteria bacterium]MDP6603773.1 dienelactone hydrolase family protein [Rhodospirillales bacterium]
MGEHICLTAEDGFELGAYRAEPKGDARGSIVVIQEVFGVNAHVREVADGFAADGYIALAPAIYDRVEPDFECGYTPEDIEGARDMRAKAGWDGPMADIAAAVKACEGKIGTVGYCWGGTLSFLAGTRIEGVACSVVYYGGQIIPYKDEKANCPMLMHFGDLDQSIPMADVDAIRAAQPDAAIHVYEGADHGFNCDHRGQHNPEAAAQARERTMAFYAQHVG